MLVVRMTIFLMKKKINFVISEILVYA